MMKIKESIYISQSPQKIWDFWLLVTTDIQWRKGFTKAEWTTQPPHGVGSAGVHYHEKLGATPWTIVKWEDGRYFEFVHGNESKLKGSVASYRVDPEGEGSRVGLQADIVGPFFMRIIAPFYERSNDKGFNK